MWSSVFAAPIRVKPRFSKRFALLLALVCGGAIILLTVVDLSSAVKFFLALLIAGLTARTVKYYLLYQHPLLPAEVVMIGDVFILDDERAAEVLGGTYVHPLLTVIRLLLPDKKHAALVLFPDALDADTFRRLRVRLRYRIRPEEKQSLWVNLLHVLGLKRKP